jgi:hypothetical protein
MPIINIYLKKKPTCHQLHLINIITMYFTCVFQISKINHEYPNNSVIHECTQAHVVQLRVIYFWYLECKSSYMFYYIRRLHWLRRFKKDFVFHRQRLNDIFDCGVILWNRCFYSTMKYQYSFQTKISIFHG